MVSGLILLLVLPFIPGAALLMGAVSVVALAAAALFAANGLPGDAAFAVAVALFAYVIRRLRLFRVSRRAA